MQHCRQSTNSRSCSPRALGTRLTAGADLSVWSEGRYLDFDTVDRFEEIDNLEAQSLAPYAVSVVVPDGFVDADLLVTELATTDDFIRIEIDDDAETRLSGASAGESHTPPEPAAVTQE